MVVEACGGGCGEEHFRRIQMSMRWRVLQHSQPKLPRIRFSPRELFRGSCPDSSHTNSINLQNKIFFQMILKNI
ncbi:hypothetical protein TSUD_342080 [Trifolium subterraneum]|nr:hypothetical protein TSUD_342080 [Trifolium subterraneum]